MERVKRALAEAADERQKLSAGQPPETDGKRQLSAGLWLAGAVVVLLVSVTAAFWPDDPSYSDTVTPLGAMEVGGLSANDPGEALESLAHKIDALGASVTLLEGKLARISMLVNSMHATATDVSQSSPVEPKPVAERHSLPETSGAPKRPWVVTLASLPSEEAATRFGRVVREQGVEVQQRQVRVEGRDFWRMQVTGFESAGAARAYAATVEQKLGLKGAWVSRR